IFDLAADQMRSKVSCRVSACAEAHPIIASALLKKRVRAIFIPESVARLALAVGHVRGGWTRISDVERNFPSAITLLFPDRYILTVAGGRLALRIRSLRHVGAIRVSQVARPRHVGAYGFPAEREPRLGKRRRHRLTNGGFAAHHFSLIGE